MRGGGYHIGERERNGLSPGKQPAAQPVPRLAQPQRHRRLHKLEVLLAMVGGTERFGFHRPEHPELFTAVEAFG